MQVSILDNSGLMEGPAFFPPAILATNTLPQLSGDLSPRGYGFPKVSGWEAWGTALSLIPAGPGSEGLMPHGAALDQGRQELVMNVHLCDSEVYSFGSTEGLAKFEP